MDLQREMQEAVALHNGGRFKEAAARYRAVLAQHPGQPDAHHLLGLALNRLGLPEPALEQVDRAIAAQPSNPMFRFSRANLLVALKRYADAEPEFRAFLDAQPRDPGARNGLAVALRGQGRSDEAERLWRELLAEAPDHVPALDNLAAALLQRKTDDQVREAEQLARRSLARHPDGAEALNNLGSSLVLQHRDEEALEPLLRAIDLRKDYAEAWFNLGLANIALKRFAAADVALRKALARDPDNVGYLLWASVATREIALHDESLSYAQRAFELDPGSPEVMMSLAQSWRDQGEYEEAEVLMRTAAERTRSVQHWCSLALMHWEMGKIEEAREELRIALSINPDSWEARQVWAQTGRATGPDDENLKELLRLEQKPDLPPAARIGVSFGLGKALDDVGRHVEAFERYALGNRLKKETGLPYQHDTGRLYEAACVEVFTKPEVRALAAYGSESEVPVFVVGLPRSGTTLTEQIIAAHPDAYGAGELLKMREVVARISALSDSRGGGIYPHAVKFLRPEDIRRYSRLYLDHILGRAGESKLRVVDKMPLNLTHLGLISLLFPKAKIVHCVRNPMDNCVSMFFQNFNRANAYANDLEDIAHYYANHRSVVEMWKKTIDLPILDFPYEQVVEDPETWSRRLIAHVGLPWDDRCLSFHESDRAIRTASAWQVKQPIYKRSVARWKRYGDGLKPLIERLRAEGIEVEE